MGNFLNDIEGLLAISPGLLRVVEGCFPAPDGPVPQYCLCMVVVEQDFSDEIALLMAALWTDLQVLSATFTKIINAKASCSV